MMMNNSAFWQLDFELFALQFLFDFQRDEMMKDFQNKSLNKASFQRLLAHECRLQHYNPGRSMKGVNQKDLRSSFANFYFKYEIKNNDLKIVFSFRILPDIMFYPEVIIKNIDKERISDIGEKKLNKIKKLISKDTPLY